MVSYEHTYIIGVLIALTIWLVFFLHRKDTRKEILTISLIFGIIGVLVESVYIKDWWRPLTITGTPIGIENFLFGFAVGGVASIVYEHLFNKRVKIKKETKIRKQKRILNLLIAIGLLAIIFSICFFIIRLNSFISTIIAFLTPTLIIYIKRKDLIKNSLLSGLATLILAIIGYHLLNIITPGFFEKFWLFKNINHIFFLGIPLEEIVWFFLAGVAIGPLYEYWKEGKLINIKT